MTYERFKVLMLVLKNNLETEREICKGLEKLLVGNYIINYNSMLMALYIELIAELIGVKSDWISWYVWENDFGEKGMSAGYDGKLKPITNLKELYELITDKG
jgi:hypothetical protein